MRLRKLRRLLTRLSKTTYKLDMATDLFDAKKYTDAKALAYTAMEYAAKAVLKLE